MAEGVSLMRLALKVPNQDLDKQNHITPFGMLFAAIHSVVPCISQGKPSSALRTTISSLAKLLASSITGLLRGVIYAGVYLCCLYAIGCLLLCMLYLSAAIC